jgi:hypothetical protein
MCFMMTSIGGTDPGFQFRSAQQAIGFRDGPLAMDPFGLNRVEPRTFAGQLTDDNAYPGRTPLDLLMVLTQPALYGVTAVPRGVVPDQQQRREALHCQAGGTRSETRS